MKSKSFRLARGRLKPKNTKRPIRPQPMISKYMHESITGRLIVFDSLISNKI
jgi:hypothetical protein